MPTTVRGFTAAHFALELNGTHAGFPLSVSGGEPFADVIEEQPVDVTVAKHLGPRRYEPIVIEFGASMAPAWYDAIEEMLEGRASALDGAIVMLDQNYHVRQRLGWKAALITEVGFPKAGADKTPVRSRAVLQPQATSLTSGSGALSGGIGGKQKQLLASNFRFAVSGLESACTRVGKVSAITVHRGDDGVLRVDDIEFTVPTLDAAPFSAWFDGLVDGKERERTAVLAFLDGSLKSEVVRLDLSAVGAFRVANERQVAGTEAIARVRVQMYCEGVALTRSGSGESKPESAATETKPATGTTTATRDQPTVERLAGALLDVLGTTARTPPTKESIAARLLNGAAAAPDETARQRGLAAGRTWAGDQARLDELEDLAAVAERDEWSALALGDNHTLRTFLAARGGISADESAVGDLMRDEYTSGLLAGIAEVHREVAPLL